MALDMLAKAAIAVILLFIIILIVIIIKGGVENTLCGVFNAFCG
jgi:hypothetical protein